MMRHSLMSALLLICALPICAGGVYYQVRDLGSAVGVSSVAYGINSSGQIAGVYTDLSGDQHPVVWTSPGSVSVLSHDGYGAAMDINDAGVVVGSSGTNAALWTSDGLRTDLAPPTGASSCVATGISSNGWIAGLGTFPGARQGAVIWSPDGSSAGIWSDSPFVETYAANAINSSGVAVGSGTHGYAPPAAFRFDSGGDAQMIAGGVFGPAAFAHDINGQGFIAGMFDSNAAVWSPDGGLIELGPGSAYGINEAGLVVGQSGGFATAWDSAAPTQLAMLPGTSSSVAFAVNESGWIVGSSTDSSGNSHATLWIPHATPMPEPSTLAYALMACVGAAGGLFARRRGS